MADENRVGHDAVPLGYEIIQINMSHDEAEPHQNGLETQSVVSIADRVPQICNQISKRCKYDTSESPVKKLHLSEDEDNPDEGKICPICLDSWTNTGDHRICSLKCGHLFGLSCITRWVVTDMNKSCPTCKTTASKHDFRYIYPRKVIAGAPTELNKLKNEMSVAIEEKNRVQMELAKSVRQGQIGKEQLDKCWEKIKILKTKLRIKKPCGCIEKRLSYRDNFVRMQIVKSLEVSDEDEDGICRVLDCKSDIDMAVTSATTKLPHSVLPAYGVQTINISKYRQLACIGIHRGPIRDIKLHPCNSCLATVSLDRYVQILDVNSNGHVASVLSKSPLWSCCWDADLSHVLYVGEQRGSVVKYDDRKMTEPLAELTVPGDTSAVVSIASIKPGLPVPFGGIIACKLNSMWAFENTPGKYTRHVLLEEGPFISMSYQNDTNHLLVSARSNARFPESRHLVCGINNQEGTLKCDTIHSFPGSSGSFFSRSCLFASTSDYVAAYQEDQKSVHIWSVNTGNKVYSIPAYDAIYDICGLYAPTTESLLTLSGKKLEFLKFYN